MAMFNETKKHIIQEFVINSNSLNRNSFYHHMIAPVSVKLARAMSEVGKYLTEKDFWLMEGSKLHTEEFYFNSAGSAFSLSMAKGSSLVDVCVNTPTIDLIEQMFVKFKYLEHQGDPRKITISHSKPAFWAKLRRG